MRLLLPLVCLALVALTVSVAFAQGINIKLSTAGYTETQGVKNFVFGVDVTNELGQSQVVSAGDFEASDPWGNHYHISGGNALQLSPGASGSLSLGMKGRISPKTLVYKPDGISLNLRGL